MDANLLLWVGQVLLALAMLTVGYGHSLAYDQSAARPGMGWLNAVGRTPMQVIGTLEMLGGIGLILPAATGILPWLTPTAAVCVAAVMVLAAIFHARRSGESLNIASNLVICAIAVLVAFGRIFVSPL